MKMLRDIAVHTIVGCLLVFAASMTVAHWRPARAQPTSNIIRNGGDEKDAHPLDNPNVIGYVDQWTLKVRSDKGACPIGWQCMLPTDKEILVDINDRLVRIEKMLQQQDASAPKK